MQAEGKKEATATKLQYPVIPCSTSRYYWHCIDHWITTDIAFSTGRLTSLFKDHLNTLVTLAPKSECFLLVKEIMWLPNYVNMFISLKWSQQINEQFMQICQVRAHPYTHWGFPNDWSEGHALIPEQLPVEPVGLLLFMMHVILSSTGVVCITLYKVKLS